MDLDDLIKITPDKVLLIKKPEDRLEAIKWILLTKTHELENIYEIEKLEKAFFETIEEIDDVKLKIESIRMFANLRGADIDRLTALFLKSVRNVKDPIERAYELFWFLRDAYNVALQPVVAEIEKTLKEIDDTEIKKEYINFVNEVIKGKFIIK
ncbi:hypothetical protein [Desulfurobacterium sp.]